MIKKNCASKILIFLSLSLADGIEYTQPRWCSDFNFDDVEYKLKHSKIIEAIPLTDFLKKNNQSKLCFCHFKDLVYVVTLEGGMKAIFKVRNNLNFIYAEIAAYRASKLLNFNLVCPVVYRIYNNQHGSLHFYIDVEYKTFAEQDLLYKQLNDYILSKMDIFRFIFGQFDTHKGNIIIQYNREPCLALIDNESIQYIQIAKYGNAPFVLFSSLGEFKLEVKDSFNDPVKLFRPNSKEVRHLFLDYFTQIFSGRETEGLIKFFSNRREVNYKIINNSLWLKLFRNYSKASNYYQSTLDAIKKIDKQFLRKIWAKAIRSEYDKKYFEVLFDTLIERRDQVLNEAKNFKVIQDTSI